jgi:hypothetical protein
MQRASGRDAAPAAPTAAAAPAVDTARSRPAAPGGSLHLLWATPVWTINAIDSGLVDPSFNDRLVQLAASGYSRFARQQTQLEARLSDDICWLNNAFFEWQQMQYHSQGGWPDLYGCADFPQLVAIMNRGVSSMADAGALHHATAQRATADASAWQVWCACHHDGTSHAAHVHEDVLLSGTYYAQVADGAAPLELYGRPGWGGLGDSPVWQWQPREGDLVLFPPWIEHGVPASSCSIGAAGDGPVRTAFSFNLLGGGWEESRRSAQRVVMAA